MKARQHPLLRLLANSRRYRGRLILATSFSILNKLFDVMPPMLIGAAVDVVVRREESFLANLGLVEMQVQLLALCALTLFVWVMESLFDYVQHIYWRNLSQTIEHDLRLEAYDHVQRMEMAWFEDRSTGRLLSILNDDINQLERFLDVGANYLIQVLATVLLIGGLFVSVAPQVAWLAFLPMPVVAWGLPLVPAQAGAPLRGGAAPGGRAKQSACQQPGRHRNHQGLHCRATRGRACARRKQPVP